MPPHVDERWRDYFGPGALSSFLVALLVAAVGAGVPVLWRLRQVLGRAARDETGPADAILVLGRMLVRDCPSRAFAARLEHGAALWRREVAPRIIVAGGMTGDASISEAAAGRELLLAQGVPAAAILTEDRSRHTLENLFNIRETLREHDWRRLVMVSDPLHLARARALALGLGLDALCSPALAAAPPFGIDWCLRAAREAFLLHWYHCGVAYSRLTRNERNLSRVT